MKYLPPTIVIPVMLVILIVIYAAYQPRAVVAPPAAVHGAAAAPGGALPNGAIANAWQDSGHGHRRKIRVAGAAVRHAGASAALSFRVGITDPHALRLGHFLGGWSSIELAAEGIIWDLAGLQPKVGCVFTRRLAMPAKRELIQALLEVATVPQAAKACWKQANQQDRTAGADDGQPDPRALAGRPEARARLPWARDRSAGPGLGGHDGRAGCGYLHAPGSGCGDRRGGGHSGCAERARRHAPELNPCHRSRCVTCATSLRNDPGGHDRRRRLARQLDAEAAARHVPVSVTVDLAEADLAGVPGSDDAGGRDRIRSMPRVRARSFAVPGGRMPRDQADLEQRRRRR